MPSPVPVPSSDELSSFDDTQREELARYIPLVEQRIAKNILGQVGEVIKADRNDRSFRRKFFSKNPDLEQFEEEVDHEAERLSQDFGNRSGLNPDLVMSELAKRVRTKIETFKRKIGGSEAPLPLSTGTPSEPGVYKTPKKEIGVLPSEDENLAEYMEEQRNFKERKLAHVAPKKKG